MPVVINGSTGITTPGFTSTAASTVSGGALTASGLTLSSGSLTFPNADTQAVGPIGGPGSNQSWQQPSRSVSTTYTNSTGKPIMVVVSCASGTINGSVYLSVSGVVVSYCNWSHNVGSISSGVTLVAIVPQSGTYVVTSNGFSVTYWNELR